MEKEDYFRIEICVEILLDFKYLLGTRLRSGGFSVQVPRWTKHGRCSGRTGWCQNIAEVSLGNVPNPQMFTWDFGMIWQPFQRCTLPSTPSL